MIAEAVRSFSEVERGRRPQESRSGRPPQTAGFAAIAGLERTPAEARQSDASMRPGAHGRRRSGTGEEFWQFRAAADGDPARMIDWRRSAKSDGHFVRDKEMQTSNSVFFWADASRSMQFSGREDRPPKADRSRLMALAAAILFARTEERVGVLGNPGRQATGMRQIDRMAVRLLVRMIRNGLPPLPSSQGRKTVLSFGFLARMDNQGRGPRLARRGDRRACPSSLDPVELSFPTHNRPSSEHVGKRPLNRFGGAIRVAFRNPLRERMEESGTGGRIAGAVAPHDGLGCQTRCNWLCQHPDGGVGLWSSALEFASPLVLLGLISLPILWILLRTMPPPARRQDFPPVVLLGGLEDSESETRSIPLWLRLLRLAAVAAAIIGFADPVLVGEGPTGQESGSPALVC